jgi:hypothetical protein
LQLARATIRTFDKHTQCIEKNTQERPFYKLNIICQIVDIATVDRYRIKFFPAIQMPEFLPEQVQGASQRVVSVAGISNSCNMDLIPAPNGEDSLKSPVVEVEAVDMEQYIEATAPDLAVDPISSDLETDSEDSDAWENLSDCDETIQFLRDDQIRDGLGMYITIPTLSYPGHPRSRRSRTFANGLTSRL